jgi:hypothetical protein
MSAEAVRRRFKSISGWCKVADRPDTSKMRTATWWIRGCGVVIIGGTVLLARPAAAAQQSGGTVTETVSTLHNRDLNGRPIVSGRVVTEHSLSDTEEQVLIETYLPGPQEGRLVLTRRIRRVTTARSYGIDTVEETEELNPGAPREPLRLIQRSLTTMRGSESTGYDIERRVFRRDTNQRFVLVLTETEHRSPR